MRLAGKAAPRTGAPQDPTGGTLFRAGCDNTVAQPRNVDGGP